MIGRTPLEAFMDDRELIPQFQKVLGGLPEQWIQEGLETGVLEEEPDGKFAHYGSESQNLADFEKHPARKNFCPLRSKYKSNTSMAMTKRHLILMRMISQYLEAMFAGYVSLKLLNERR